MHDIETRLRWCGRNLIADGRIGDGELSIEAANTIARLLRVEADHKNVLKAALYNEPNGIDLVKRLTTFAVEARGSFANADCPEALDFIAAHNTKVQSAKREA